MSLLIILGLFIAGILFSLFNYPELSLLFYTGGTFYLLAVGSGIIPAFLLKRLQASYPLISQPQWKENNVIILLGWSTLKVSWCDTVKPTLMCYSRIFETTKLYFSCKKSGHQCKIIISGGDVATPGFSEAEIYYNELLSVGVNSSDIILESQSRNTYQNADFTSALLRNGSYDQAFLVMSAPFLKRALIYFANFDIHPIPCPSDYISAWLSIIPTSYNLVMADFCIQQYIGIFRYSIYNFFGWNNKKNK